MYYNTNNLAGQELTEQTAKNEAQKQLVFQVFKENPNKKMTWDYAFKYYQDNKELPFGKPIRENSFKRSITELYKENKLKKTETTIKATYGSCHQYYFEKMHENKQTSLF